MFERLNCLKRRWEVLLKKCKCGRTMRIQLRNVIYSNLVEIENVPVYSCQKCHRSEVLSEVKPDLTGMIEEVSEKRDKQRLHFEESNELAYLLFQASDHELLDIPVEELLAERINQLLDLMLIAKSVNDTSWLEDLQRRLGQITKTSTLSFHTK